MKYLSEFSINKNLITIKWVLFLFFGAIGSAFPFLLPHMEQLGLPKDDSIIISVVSPLIALIGPLVAAPLADRLAGGFGGAPRSKTGRYLTLMISACCVLATLFFWLLLIIPPIIKSDTAAAFICDETGGFIIQDQCATSEEACYDWGEGKGSVLVQNCIFSCNATTSYKVPPTPLPEIGNLDDCKFSCNATTSSYKVPPIPLHEIGDLDDTTSSYVPPTPLPEIDDLDEDIDPTEPDYTYPLEPEKTTNSISNGSISSNITHPQTYPHMCWNNGTREICEVYTEMFRPIEFNIGLKPSLENDTEAPCKYPFADQFYCRLYPEVVSALKNDSDGDCQPIVLCEIHDPYSNPDSLLKKSQCGFNTMSFWMYLFFRSFGELFLAAAVTLLAASVVIATRETSTGRGDVGKQFAAGALGMGIFALAVGIEHTGDFSVAMIYFTVLMALAVFILLADPLLPIKMPLSPPEWWWHTRSGLLALPMSSVRKYGLETAALVLVLFILGVFWNAIDSYLPWRIIEVVGKNKDVILSYTNETNDTAIEEVGYSPEVLLIGASIAVASIPAVVFLVFAEKIVDYCGHSNILIFCFISYIWHHLGLINITSKNTSLFLLCEFLELFTLHIMYITAVLYLRHLIPRKLTACAQALPIIAHFCLGRCIGALLGGIAFPEESRNKDVFLTVHKWFAIAAVIVAIIYFLAYHFYLKPKCGAPVHLPPDPAPAVIQSMNGNGSYTPLRVYHNSKSKKGHFRY